MRLLSLCLRGAIGIERGLGVEDVSIDFARFEPGIVALVAPNGRGKSTILESLHPYRTLVSRNGSLASHFSLRDSHRILKFEMAGSEWEARILLDGQNGKSEAYLYRDGASMNDGKLTTYDAAVRDAFGSEGMFFRSLFRSQGAASFAALTATERKSLFVELLGLERLARYHEVSKVHRDEIGLELERHTSRADVYREKAAEFDTINTALAEAVQAVEAQGGMLRMAEEHVNDLRVRISTLERETERTRDLRARRDALISDRGILVLDLAKIEQAITERERAFDAELAKIEKSLEDYRKIAASADRIRAKAEELHDLEQHLADMDGRKEQHDRISDRMREGEAKYRDEQSRARTLLTDAEKVVDARKARIDAFIHDRNRQAEMLSREIAACERRAALMCGVPCSSHPEMQSTCELLADARAAEQQIAAMREKLADIEAQTADELEKELAVALTMVNTLTEELAQLEQDHVSWRAQMQDELDAVGYKADQHTGLRGSIATLKSQGWDVLLSKLATADEVIAREEAHTSSLRSMHEESLAADRRALADANTRMRSLGDQIAQVDAELDAAAEAVRSLEALRRDLASGEQVVANERALLERMQRDVAALEVRLQECEDARAQVAASEAGAVSIRNELAEWEFLVRATGKNGIQAIELDAAGPNVSAIANELLADTFGSLYQVAFDTTRSSSDGKKQLEVFDVRVTSDAGEQRIEDLSGGQRVWIEAALAQAIGIYLRRKSGLDLRTNYLDEADGALDTDNAFRYLRMLRASHDRSGAHHSIIITHRQELLAHIPQQIHLVPGEGIRYEA